MKHLSIKLLPFYVCLKFLWFVHWSLQNAEVVVDSCRGRQDVKVVMMSVWAGCNCVRTWCEWCPLTAPLSCFHAVMLHSEPVPRPGPEGHHVTRHPYHPRRGPSKTQHFHISFILFALYTLLHIFTTILRTYNTINPLQIVWYSCKDSRLVVICTSVSSAHYSNQMSSIAQRSVIFLNVNISDCWTTRVALSWKLIHFWLVLSCQCFTWQASLPPMWSSDERSLTGAVRPLDLNTFLFSSYWKVGKSLCLILLPAQKSLFWSNEW